MRSYKWFTIQSTRSHIYIFTHQLRVHPQFPRPFSNSVNDKLKSEFILENGLFDRQARVYLAYKHTQHAYTLPQFSRTLANMLQRTGERHPHAQQYKLAAQAACRQYLNGPAGFSSSTQCYCCWLSNAGYRYDETYVMFGEHNAHTHWGSISWARQKSAVILTWLHSQLNFISFDTIF